MTDIAIPMDGVQLRGLKRVEFEALVDTGVMEGKPVELLGGELITMSPQGSRHSFVIKALNRQLAPLMGQALDVGVQVPLAIDDESLPEPDISVTDPATRDAHPTSAHAVIEVAVTSQTYDLQHKAPRYAAAGVPLYIVLDLVEDRVVVHRDPEPDGYRTLSTLGAGGSLEIMGVTLDLAELLGG